MSKLRKLVSQKIKELFGNNSELIERIISPTIGINLISGKITNSNFYCCKSKIGGFPDIENDFVWPMADELPLTFLCQINLSEAITNDVSLGLSGMLYFFVANSEVDRYPESVRHIKVIHKDELSNKKRLVNKNIVPIPEYFVDFFESYTIPSYQEKIMTTNNFYNLYYHSIEELDEFISEITDKEDEFITHSMLGEPNAVQGAVRTDWGARSIFPTDYFDENLPHYLDQADEIGSKYVLLLQLDLTDDRIKLSNYGDACLYFGIHKDDFLKKDFSKVILVTQNT